MKFLRPFCFEFKIIVTQNIVLPITEKKNKCIYKNKFLQKYRNKRQKSDKKIFDGINIIQKKKKFNRETMLNNTHKLVGPNGAMLK